jgi:O-antigen/teichoic acid export membrane protein
MLKDLARRINNFSLSWVLLDQIVVSALNFSTGILLARFLGIEGYGNFVLAYSILLYANTFQQALIIAPMLSIAPQFNALDRLNYLKGMLFFQFFLSAFICLLILFIGTVFLGEFSRFSSVVFSLSFATFFFQLQDWIRRYYFILNKEVLAFWNDLLSYGGQVLILVLLFKLETLTITLAFWAISISSAIAFVLAISVEKLFPAKDKALESFLRSWKPGFNLLLAGQINWLGSQGVLVVSGLTLGAQILGGLRSAQNIVGPFNILFQGMENFVPVKAAYWYAQDHLRGLVQFLSKTSVYGGFLLSVPSALIGVFSPTLIYFFRTIEKTHQIVLGSLIASFLSIAFSVVFSQSFEATGVMFSLLLGQIGYIVYFTFIAAKYLKSNAL